VLRSSHPRVKRFAAVSPKLVVPQHLLLEFQSFKNDSALSDVAMRVPAALVLSAILS
jgi:hypothetical protein